MNIYLFLKINLKYLLIIILILLYLYILNYLQKVYRKKLKGKRLLNSLFEIIKGFLFYLTIHLYPYSNINHIYFIDSIKNFSTFILALSFLKSLYIIKPFSKKLKILLTINISLIYFINLLENTLHIHKYFNSISIIKELILLTNFLIFLNLIIKILFKSNIFISIIAYIISFTFILLKYIKILNISIEKLLIKFSILYIMHLLYNLTINYTHFYIKKFAKNNLNKEDKNIIFKNLKNIYTIFLSLLYLNIIIITFKIENTIDNYLKIYIIKNKIISINTEEIINGIIIFIISISIIKIITKLIKFYLNKKNKSLEAIAAENLIFNISLPLILIIVMSSIGLTWKIIIPLAGTLGVGIGFGLQTIINNYISGFILLFSKNLKIGDIVELPISISSLGTSHSSVFGIVEEISILTTTIKTNDGVEISVPNSKFISSHIINYSKKDSLIRLQFPVGVSYSSDPEKVKDIIMQTLYSMPEILKKPAPSVWFTEYADSSINFIASGWIDIRKNRAINKEIKDKFYYNLWYKLKQNNIEIPFPQNDIWFRNSLKIEKQ